MNTNTGSDLSCCCFAVEARTFSFFCLEPRIRHTGSQHWKITAVLCCCRECWETMWCCSPGRKDTFYCVVALCHLQLPIPTQGAARGGREKVMLSKHLRADSTPGDGSLMARELYCLRFEWWTWQPPPHTNWVRVPFCGCLAWQALSTLLDKRFHWLVLLQQSAELSGSPRLRKCGFHVNLGRSTAKIAPPRSASDFCKCHYIIVGLQLRFPVKLHRAYSKSLLHHKQAPFKFLV